jgi:AraC-like DNA-binding protein
MPKKTGLGKALDEILADLEDFLAIRDVFVKGVMVNSLIEMFFLHSMSKNGLAEKTKITGDGHIELIPKRSCAEGNYLLKPAGKRLVVNVANLSFRQPFEYTVKDQPEYFFIGLRPRFPGIGGARGGKDKIYHQHLPTGFLHSGVGVLFLPEFFDAFLNSRSDISPGEITRAIDALGKFPLIPDAAVILKQIGEASFAGNVRNIWIEAKALELVAVVLDWHRRLAASASPPLKEQDRLGIAEAIRYAEEHFSGPLTLETLAKQAAMSISKFTAAFKMHTGLSAASYIRRIRMDKAMYLLKNSTASLSDIAGMVGYKHYSRFFTLFREQFGVRPGEFRKRD